VAAEAVVDAVAEEEAAATEVEEVEVVLGVRLPKDPRRRTFSI